MSHTLTCYVEGTANLTLHWRGTQLVYSPLYWCGLWWSLLLSCVSTPLMYDRQRWSYVTGPQSLTESLLSSLVDNPCTVTPCSWGRSTLYAIHREDLGLPSISSPFPFPWMLSSCVVSVVTWVLLWIVYLRILSRDNDISACLPFNSNFSEYYH